MVAGALLLGATSGLGTLAYWNDVETVSGGTVTAGSLDLTVEGVQGPYTLEALQMLNMAPGESVAAEMTVQNAGSTPFDLELTSTGAGALVTHAVFTVRVGGSATSDDSYPRIETCEGGSGSSGRVEPNEFLRVCIAMKLGDSTSPTMQGELIVPSFTFTATQAQP